MALLIVKNGGVRQTRTADLFDVNENLVVFDDFNVSGKCRERQSQQGFLDILILVVIVSSLCIFCPILCHVAELIAELFMPKDETVTCLTRI